MRFYIQVQETRNGRRNTFNFNRQPVRPGTVSRTFVDAVNDQYAHMSEGGAGYSVVGIGREAGLDSAVMMWTRGGDLRRGVVITVVRATGGR